MRETTEETQAIEEQEDREDDAAIETPDESTDEPEHGGKGAIVDAEVPSAGIVADEPTLTEDDDPEQVVSAKPGPEPGTRLTVRVLPVRLTPEERAERGIELAEKHAELQRAEDNAKAMAKNQREELAGIRVQVLKLREATLNSVETRHVDCREVADYEKHIWRVYRLDTGDEVPAASRELTPAEEDGQRQKPIAFEGSVAINGPEVDAALEAAAADGGKPFTCVECLKDAVVPEEAIHDESEGMFLDHDGRKTCTEHHDEAEYLAAQAGAVRGGLCAHNQITHRLKADRGTICPECLESVKAPPLDADLHQIAEGAETILANKSEPGYDFDESEEPPAAIASARAVDTDKPKRGRKPEARA